MALGLVDGCFIGIHLNRSIKCPCYSEFPSVPTFKEPTNLVTAENDPLTLSRRARYLAEMTSRAARASEDDINASDESKYNGFAHHGEPSAEKGMSGEEYHGMSSDEERRMVRKFDWRILPVVSALYIMSFLNRVNIGTSSNWDHPGTVPRD